MHDLNGIQRDVMYVVAGMDEPYGLAVKAELEEYYDTELNPSQVYQGLDTLVEKGLVEKGQLDRRTNAYSLTQRGRRELEARHEWKRQYYSSEMTGPAEA